MFDVSLAQANLWFDISNLVLLSGAVAVALGTFGVMKMSTVKERFSDERISENEARTAQADEKAARLGLEAEQARLEQEKLKAQLAWRRLSEPQFKGISAGLIDSNRATALPRIRLAAVGGDPEAMLFATDFRKALSQADIKVPIDSVLVAANSPILGITVFGPKLDAMRIAQIIAGAGIDVVVKEQVGDVQILVGSKPPPE